VFHPLDFNRKQRRCLLLCGIASGERHLSPIAIARYTAWLAVTLWLGRKYVGRAENLVPFLESETKDALVGVKKTGRGRRKLGRKKRRMRARIRHRKK
jgi:hypothetical protein